MIMANLFFDRNNMSHRAISAYSLRVDAPMEPPTAAIVSDPIAENERAGLRQSVRSPVVEVRVTSSEIRVDLGYFQTS